MTTASLLPYTDWATVTGVPPITITGTPVKAPGYYKKSVSHTVVYSLTGFTGNIAIQGTLLKDPTSADWVTLYTIPRAGSAITTSSSSSTSGRFVWLRVIITEFTAGVINNIDISY
jgi:hypothetical protein